MVVLAEVVDNGRVVDELAALALQARQVKVDICTCIEVCLVERVVLLKGN